MQTENTVTRKKALSDQELLEFVALVREWSEACLQVLGQERLSLSGRSGYDSPEVLRLYVNVQP
jgi:hypothetical protein